MVESADEAEATAAPQPQGNQDAPAPEAPQEKEAPDSEANAVTTAQPARRLVGHNIVFPTSPQPPVDI